jgi:ADP-ribose pyrophosphatase
MNSDYWKTKNITQVHKNPWFSVCEHGITMHNGKDAAYYVVHANASVFIVPISYDGQIYLIKQFRYPNKNTSWELPAGAIDKGEKPLEAAQRELLEETGLKGTKWEAQGSIYLTPGLTSSTCTIYRASGLTMTGTPEYGDEAILECRKFQEYEIKDLIRNEEMTDGPSIAILSKVLWIK